MDEWTDESAAQIALDRLRVFIEQRDVPAVVTSRPHGFDRLGIRQVGWQLGEIANFSVSQQRALSKIWFTYRIKSSYKNLSYDEQDVERQADSEADSLLSELSRSADLQELAKTPLLLCLLIYHKCHNARLPQSRFKAYDSLLEHLIFTHPQKRRSAASVTDNSSELSDEDVKTIFARLAYHIQEVSGEGIIPSDGARAVVEDYLKDDDYGFGLELHSARKIAREFLDIGESTIGILVKRSPQELGFFHRTFQEHLAAVYLSSKSLAAQRSVIETHCVNTQWREVILSLCSITSRPDDIKEFIECIKCEAKTASAFEGYSIEVLLAEIAFGDFNCSVGMARELAQNIFGKIELESWMGQRERLLECVMSGLRSTKVKELVKAKITNWFPERARWRGGIYEAMATWPRLPEVIATLWKGLHDEEANHRRAAAKALAELMKGDPGIGQ